MATGVFHYLSGASQCVWRLAVGPSKLVIPEVRRPTMDTFTERRQLADDLSELGDTSAALVRQAIDRFSAWKFEAGEALLERALVERRKHEQEPPPSPYFKTGVLAIL